MEPPTVYPTELKPHELMQKVADFFQSQGIAYWVVGSMASMAYGEPRFTNDVDIVADLKVEHAVALCEAFRAPDYYLSEAAVREAIARRFQFNILHPASGLKVDVFIPADTDFSRSEASRIKRITSKGEYSAWFGSPEDVLLHKLIYFQLSGGVSDKHLRDIAGMLRVRRAELDRDYIVEWASRLGVISYWEMVEKRLDEERP